MTDREPSLVLVLLAASVRTLAGATCDLSYTNESAVFRSPDWAHDQLAVGDLTLLDARGGFGGHIAGAAHAPWSSFTLGGFRTPTGGVLRGPAELRAAVQALGVSPTEPVLVYGEWELQWGEEGRLHWMLSYLGHPEVYILAGGLQAYRTAHPDDITSAEGDVTTAGDWDVQAYPIIDSLRATLDELLSGDPLFVVDVRTQDEFFGTSTPYGEQREGHVAGAVSYPMISLWSGSCLKTCEEFQSELVTTGWDEQSRVVAYCTAGIRSGFFWSVMRHCLLGGSAVANYDGSMWEYTSDSSAPMCTSAGEAETCTYTPSKAPGRWSSATAWLMLALPWLVVDIPWLL